MKYNKKERLEGREKKEKRVCDRYEQAKKERKKERRQSEKRWTKNKDNGIHLKQRNKQTNQQKQRIDR